MHILVLGSEGNIGKAVVHAFKKLGHSVLTFDIDPANYREGHHTSFKTAIQELSISTYNREKCLAFSCLPYHMNFKYASEIVFRSIPYFDLGGSRTVSKSINGIDNGVTVFTDLGLAPGWVNLIAEEGFSNGGKPYEIRMYCGGLPTPDEQYNCGPFKYARTWSTEGLINEYIDDCEVLKNGEMIKVPGMSNLRYEDEYIAWNRDKKEEDYLYLESFSTSGGLAHSGPSFQKRGVLDASYKTLRYHGHHRLMSEWLKSHREASQENVAKLNELIPASKNQDMVVVGASMRGPGRSTSETYVIYGDDKFSAMQKATAFPAVAVATQLERLPSSPCSYENVDLEKFNLTLNELFGWDV